MSTHLELQATAARLLAAGTPAVLVEVLGSRGSVPRGDGTRMLVTPAEVLGTVGGGHLEWQAIADARRLLAAGGDALPDRHIALGPTLGQCCGGALDLRIERLQPRHLADWPRAEPRFTLQLHGAGHVGRAIVELLAGIDCRVQWIDERESEFPAHRPWPAHIEIVNVEPAEAEVDTSPPGAFYLVLTHSHELDQRIAEAILKRGDFAFFGLIGSRTKRVRFTRRFEQRGIAAQAIARMTCPIGVPGIEGKEPQVIAVAVVAQLLQVASQRAVGGSDLGLLEHGPGQHAGTHE